MNYKPGYIKVFYVFGAVVSMVLLGSGTGDIAAVVFVILILLPGDVTRYFKKK